MTQARLSKSCVIITSHIIFLIKSLIKTQHTMLSMSSLAEAELGESEVGPSVSGAEVTKVVSLDCQNGW